MPFKHTQPIDGQPAARGQAYVEYGLLVAVLLIAFLVGMNALLAGATTYMARAEPTPNATVLAGLPNHVVRIDMRCTPLPQPNYTGVAINCSLTVTDITTIEPATLPKGSMQFSSAPAGGTFNPSPCTLTGAGVTSGCTFTYTPNSTRQQDITATYVPTSNHQSRSQTLPGVVRAVDKTQTQLTCLDVSVPVGEPSQCNVRVLDVYTNLLLSNVEVGVTATRGSGSFSPVGQLSPRGPSYNCVTDTNGVCGTLFRSGAASSSDEGAYTINAAFDAVAQGDEDHDSSNATPGVVVTVGAPTMHPATITLSCDGGGGLGQTPGSPLQINLGASSRCMPTITDSNPNDRRGNPTAIAPTGNANNWNRNETPDYGGAGNLSGTTCQLQQVTDATAQCQPPPMTYTPTSVGGPPGPDYVGDHKITAVYSGDWTHQGGATAAPTDVYVKDQHLVQVIVPPCTSGTDRLFPLLIGVAPPDTTQCSVTVTDQASNPQTPTGTVTWEPQGTDGTGNFSPPSCTLQPAGPVGTAACAGQVKYQVISRGTPDGTDQESTHNLAAIYSGDWLHPQETGLTPVFVGNLHTANVSVSCSPGDKRTAPLRVGLAATTTCTVSVVDPGPSPRTPTGQVGWGMTPVGLSGFGGFTTPNPCQLTSAGPDTATCQVTYQPTARGNPDGGGPDTDNTHTIKATYSGDGLHPPPGGVNQTATAPVYVDN